ncbi:hypothetical protein BIZ78_gp041 [Erwinia phage vB_EamM_Caitlin]|uniref:hypothetical protein n=1 Tax=Erwinia phage vB_EamM_Caitlin TaxID=1883379 RepID=UPI00081CB00C|nr:hypothetical protein BIZ78_gp041 [Erwinia phage vB_EamM_Caitlin]ANZ48534.1 hypothetical protein CAITLIN_239 [Erwinia phage vB_EamM_Caitlin]
MSFLDVLDEVEQKMEQEVIKVARESVSTEKEKEYCLWVKPTVEGWRWLYAQQGHFHLDVLMPIAGGRRRIRIEEGKAELTLKRWSEENGTVEENSDIGFDTALTFYADGHAAHLVRRIRLEPGELAEKGGKHWDIDVFYSYQGRPMLPDLQAFKDVVEAAEAGTSYGEWVKVELEVERYELESIREFIPFEVEATMASRPSNQEDQVFLRDYWDNVISL